MEQDFDVGATSVSVTFNISVSSFLKKNYVYICIVGMYMYNLILKGN